MRRVAVAVACLALASAVASAQSEFKNDLSVTVGRTFLSDRTIPSANTIDNVVHSGKGTSLDFTYDRYLVDRKPISFAVELPVIYDPDEDLNFGLNQTPSQYYSIFVTPAAHVSFWRGAPISPWASFGGGFGHFEASNDLLFGGNNPGHRVKNTGALHWGVGVDLGLPRWFHHMSFRFEARDNWTATAPINVSSGQTRQNNLYVGGGLAFRF